MATFDMKKPSTSAEGDAASNFGKKSGKASAFGNALQVGVGIFAGSKGKNPSQGAGGGGGGSRERSAEDWQNENTMKEYDLDRETRRGDYHYGASGKNTPEGSKLRKLAADGKGGFSVEYGDVIKDVQNQTAGDSTPKPNPSGHSEGKQWSSTGKSKGRKGTYTDTRAAVAGGHITEEDAIEISPTYAKKYASRAAGKKANASGFDTPSKPVKSRKSGINKASDGSYSVNPEPSSTMLSNEANYLASKRRGKRS
jgi:hypothetical protein